jgi:hypothetical protein
MASTNDITGDSIQTGIVSDEYREGHEIIFGKKEPKPRWVPPPLVVDDQKAEDEAFDAIKTTSTILGSETQSQ